MEHLSREDLDQVEGLLSIRCDSDTLRNAYVTTFGDRENLTTWLSNVLAELVSRCRVSADYDERSDTIYWSRIRDEKD